MTLAEGFISAAIASLAVVSILHSFFGEKLLLVPMFERRGNAILESDFARKVLRAAWHLTSLLWVMMAIILFSIIFNPTRLADMVLLTFGTGFLLSGLYSLIHSRGRHIGWPALSAIGIFCLSALAVKGAAL